MSLLERFEKLLKQGVSVELASELVRPELTNATRSATKQQELFPAPMLPMAMSQALAEPRKAEPRKAEPLSVSAEVAAGIEEMRAAHAKYKKSPDELKDKATIHRGLRGIYRVAADVYPTIKESVRIITLARTKCAGRRFLSETLQANGVACDASDLEAWEEGYRLPEDVEVVALAAIVGLEVDHCVQTVRRGREVVNEYRDQLGMCKVYRVPRR